MSLTAGVVLAVVLVALYVTWTAGRLDRLHARVDAAWAALDAQLVRRAAAARALAPLLPAGPVRERLAGTATTALAPGPVAREARENDLSGALHAARPLLAALPVAATEELTTAVVRVGLARAFHNAAVADARRVRVRRLVRLLRLAGHRALPEHFDIDDGAAGPGRDVPLSVRRPAVPPA